MKTQFQLTTRSIQINVRNRHASSISRLLLLVKAEISLEYSYLTDPPQNKSETGLSENEFQLKRSTFN
ncbi:hypothetical protein T02_6454 [Trichinella nativa]|uniref:Uncharacterized protein n=1 Tax=Trichinella nativa TaxID=6335 RepID=A0A0V1LFY8_9BILA|nr:hypothetical protein T02_6454 [Trichinella nativa]